MTDTQNELITALNKISALLKTTHSLPDDITIEHLATIAEISELAKQQVQVNAALIRSANGYAETKLEDIEDYADKLLTTLPVNDKLGNIAAAILSVTAMGVNATSMEIQSNDIAELKAQLKDILQAATDRAISLLDQY